MAKLQNFNGRYCESEYENAFIAFLEQEGWNYLAGNSISRSSKREVLYTDDLEQFLSKTNADLTVGEIRQIIDTVRLVGSESEFSTLHKVIGWMVNGIQFTPQSGLAKMVACASAGFLSSITHKGIPLTNKSISGRRVSTCPLLVYSTVN